MSNYSVGQYITYQAFGGIVRRIKVTEKLADVKNGRAGFVGTLSEFMGDEGSVWGYDSQIVIDAPKLHNCPAIDDWCNDCPVNIFVDTEEW